MTSATRRSSPTHRGAFLIPFALTGVLAGCAAAGPAGGSNPSASLLPGSGASEQAPALGSGRPTAGGSPSASGAGSGPERPTIGVTVAGDRPIIAAGDGPAGHPFAMPAAFTVGPDGTAALFVVWFSEEAGDQIVTVSTSRDGRTWSVGTKPIYTDLGLSYAAPGPVPSVAMVEADGTWVLYGWGSARADRDMSETWRATAPDAAGPWTADPGPVLTPARAGSWDAGSAAASTILRGADGLTMWYDGHDGGAGIQGAVGLATSDDGRAWQRWDDPVTSAAGDPVVSPRICGRPTDGAVVQPHVRPHGESLLMLFAGLSIGVPVSPIYAAWSDDGRAWSCASETPLLRHADLAGSQGLHRFRGGELAGREVLFVESVESGRSSIWLATLTVGGP